MKYAPMGLSWSVGNPVSIIMLNIPSIMGGCDIWSKSRKIGVRDDTQSGLLDKLQVIGMRTSYTVTVVRTLVMVSSRCCPMIPYSASRLNSYVYHHSLVMAIAYIR